MLYAPSASHPRIVLAGFSILSFSLLISGGAIASEAAPSFFNSVEIKSGNLEPFKKWTSALERHSMEAAKEKEGTCNDKTANKCHYSQWIKFIESIRGKDQMTQLAEVNRLINKAQYITDEKNWGMKDYWAAPGEFMARFGDCEDYAISKYISLKMLGFKPEQLRVAAVNDMNLKIGHAVLIVFLDQKAYVLDNQIKQVVDAKSITHYQPVFSINDDHWWRHRA